jgi:hypothetical protein
VRVQRFYARREAPRTRIFARGNWLGADSYVRNNCARFAHTLMQGRRQIPIRDFLSTSIFRPAKSMLTSDFIFCTHRSLRCFSEPLCKSIYE